MTDVVPFRPRPPGPGDTSSFVGMAIFLGAWAMTFAALFFAYADMRLSTPMWPDSGVTAPVLLPAINTVVLLASSVTLALAVRAVRTAHPRGLVAWLATTLGLGLVFLALQGLMWRGLVEAGLTWSSGRYGAVLYSLTTFHALHVLVGIAGLVGMLAGARAGKYTVQRHASVRNWAMFWHFVDVIWVVMFFTVYVL